MTVDELDAPPPGVGVWRGRGFDQKTRRRGVVVGVRRVGAQKNRGRAAAGGELESPCTGGRETRGQQRDDRTDSRRPKALGQGP